MKYNLAICPHKFHTGYDVLRDECKICGGLCKNLPIKKHIIHPDEQINSLLTEWESIHATFYDILTELRIKYYHMIGKSLVEFLLNYTGDKSVSEIVHICAVNSDIKSERNVWYAKKLAETEPDVEEAIKKYGTWSAFKARAEIPLIEEAEREKCPTCGRLMPK